tara:strand:- start:5595 stop:5711 length:117 start_codon:yes stop_codon:yes gene_type:complete
MEKPLTFVKAVAVVAIAMVLTALAIEAAFYFCKCRFSH